MDTLDISVIIPTHNRRHEVPRALQSISKQTLKPLEVILVDDGSTDGTNEFLANYQADFRLRIFTHTESHGVAIARNTGLEHALGRFIAFLDSDDEWLPRKLELQYPILVNNHEIGIVCTNRRVIHDGVVIETGHPSAALIRSGRVLDQVLRVPYVLTSTVIIPSDVLQQVGKCDKTLTHFEDRDLWIRISEHYEVRYLPTVLCNRHLGTDNLSSDPHAMLRARIRLFEKLKKRDHAFCLADRAFVRRELGRSYRNLGYRLRKGGCFATAWKLHYQGLRTSPSLLSAKELLLSSFHVR